MTEQAVKRLKLSLIRSPSGRSRRHRACVRGLGLRKMHSTALIADTPENHGMVNAVAYMLKVEEVGDAS